MIAKLKPVCKDYLWGGTRLKDNYNKQSDYSIVAETWELSCHKDGESIIASGDNKGMSLRSFIENNKDSCGTFCEKYKDFPILVKFIDAKQNLSIQVHPADDYARKYEGDNGKNEMWYIAEAEEDAFIYYGFSKTITKEEYKKHIENNTLTDVLKKVSVKAGDCFYISAGTVHAIGSGCLIAEIQQSSNVTYRVYDYGRKDVDGNARELHIDKAVDVSVLEPAINTALNGTKLIDCEYFSVDNLISAGKISLKADNKSFHSILILDGKGELTGAGDSIEFSKGDSLFISAGSGSYDLNGTFHALLVYLS